MLSLDYGQDVPLTRPTRRFGEETPVAKPPVFVTWQLDEPGIVATENGAAVSQSGSLYAYRGTDIRDGDKVGLPIGRSDDGAVRNVTFKVIADPKWDQDHGMNGHDFGVIKFKIERGG